MSKLVTLIAGLVVLWALFQFGARTKAPLIQADILSRTELAITDADLADVNVTVDGRDVELGGSVEDEAQAKQAVEVASGVRGIHLVNSDLAIAPGRAYFTRFCKEPGNIVLTGNVPDEESRNAFSDRARDLFRHRTIKEDLTVSDGAPAGFRRFMDQTLSEVGQLDEGCVTLNGTEVLISGTVRSEPAEARIHERIEIVSDLGFKVTFDLQLPSLSEQALACQSAYNNLLEPEEAVLFDFDSATLHTAGRQLLDEILKIATLCPDIGAIVAGHADSIGDKEYNIDLSERRAESVVAYAVSNGIDPDRLTAVGFGFSQPVADNSTDEGRAKNRRIEFRVQEK
jgi:OOP family OmpA-OmpF porin